MECICSLFILLVSANAVQVKVGNPKEKDFVPTKEWQTVQPGNRL